MKPHIPGFFCLLDDEELVILEILIILEILK